MELPDIATHLDKIPKKQFVMLINRFEQYSVRPHVESLKQKEKELDRLKLRKDYRNTLCERVEAARILQQIRVDLVELSRIKEQAISVENAEFFESRGELLRSLLIKSAAEILERHPEIKKPMQEQEDILLIDVEDNQGYALAAEDVSETCKADQLADLDVLSRVEDIQTDIGHVASMMEQFWKILKTQGETTSTIEANLAQADTAVTEGSAQLALAAHYKAGIYPVMGAVIGGAIAGPIGVLSGIKLAGVIATVAGSLLGYQGGNLLKRRTLTVLPVESKPQEESNFKSVDSKKTV